MSRVAALIAGFQSGERWPGARRLAHVMMRYALSTLGPMSIAAAHFLAALIFLHALSAAAFGLFSFVLVIVPFALSATGALLNAPLARAAHAGKGDLSVYFKTSLAFSAAAGLAIGALMYAGGADARLSAILAVYCATMTLRWFGRCHAYTLHHPGRAVASDIAYALFLLCALCALYVFRSFSENHAAGAMVCASIAGLCVLGRTFARALLQGLMKSSLAAYRREWRELSRWSLLGVVSTELTMNAHAYLVTFISGPKAFALIAVGSLFMRPTSLAMAALPDLERPVMARDLAGGKIGAALRAVKEFRTAMGAVWIATMILAAVILTWFPHFLIRSEYDPRQVLTVIAFYAAIMAVRISRMPESVLFQAAGEFRALAWPSVWSSAVSVAATFALLVAFGPVASLAGIFAGDVVMTANIFGLARRWKAAHA